jgi:hypothetical protein
MPIPIETVRGFDTFGVKVLVPGRTPDDLSKYGSAGPRARKEPVLIYNGLDQVAAISVAD